MNRLKVILLLLVLLIPITAYADNNVPIRAYLVDQGYEYDQITYDMERNMVQLNGRDFYGTWPKEDGKTYGAKVYLDELITKHKKGDYMVVMDAPVTMIK